MSEEDVFMKVLARKPTARHLTAVKHTLNTVAVPLIWPVKIDPALQATCAQHENRSEKC